MKNELGLRLNQRLMSLSHSDIYWGPRSQEDISFIDSYREFPNVPLLGIRGGITYNPSLALRQFGYARRDGPHDMFIQCIVFDYSNDLQGYHQRFIRAWGTVKKTDSKTLGRKNSIHLEPYLKWVRAHAQSLVMPYAAVLPVISESIIQGNEPHIIFHLDMPTNFEEL